MGMLKDGPNLSEGDFFYLLEVAGEWCGDKPKKSSISWISTKLGWFDQLMGGVDYPQYFLSGPTHMGGAAPPPRLILLIKPKFYVVAPFGLKLRISYILVKALMGNFQFWPWFSMVEI